MSMRDRLRAILRRVPFGLGVPGTMDHPTTGGLTRERAREDAGPDEGDTDPEETDGPSGR